MKILIILNYRIFLSKLFSIILVLLLYSNKEFNYSQLSQFFIEVILNYINCCYIIIENSVIFSYLNLLLKSFSIITILLLCIYEDFNYSQLF